MALGESLPKGAELRDSREGYRIFNLTPEADQAGSYTIRLIAAAGVDQSLRSDMRFTIVVSGETDDAATPRIQVPEAIEVLIGEHKKAGGTLDTHSTLQESVE